MKKLIDFFQKLIEKDSDVQIEKIQKIQKIEIQKEKEKEKEKQKKDKRSAILIGLNYPGSYYSLNGCINDIKNGDELLKTYGYETKLLTDSEISNSFNVLEALEELKNNDSNIVFFHYSGHGTQTPDLDDDEIDKLDEVIYSKDGHLIKDDEINKSLSTFPKEKTVFLVFDCCHSGTIVDLQYTITDDGFKIINGKNEIKAKIICITGCMDSQTAADITENNVSYGALSSTLYTLLKENRNKKLTWKQLYKKLIIKMSNKHYKQIPQLSVSDSVLLDNLVKF